MDNFGTFPFKLGWNRTVSSGAAPANTVAPTTTGTPKTDEVLSGTDGTWTGDATITYTYQWQESTDGVSFSNKSGETNSTYTVVYNDIGKYIRRNVYGDNGVGSPVLALSSNSLRIYFQELFTESSLPSDWTLDNVGSVGVTFNGNEQAKFIAAHTSVSNQSIVDHNITTNEQFSQDYLVLIVQHKWSGINTQNSQYESGFSLTDDDRIYYGNLYDNGYGFVNIKVGGVVVHTVTGLIPSMDSYIKTIWDRANDLISFYRWRDTGWQVIDENIDSSGLGLPSIDPKIIFGVGGESTLSNGGNDGSIDNIYLLNTDITTQTPNGVSSSINNVNSVLLNGTSQYININNVREDLALTTEGTMWGWVKIIDATPIAASKIVSFGDTDANSFITIDITSDGRLRAICRITGTTQWSCQTSAGIFTNNTWAFWSVVKTSTDVILYVNEVNDTTFTVSTDKTKYFNDIAGLDNGTIGCLNQNSAGAAFFLNGNIMGMGFSTDAKNKDEIIGILNLELPKDESGISNGVSYFRLGDNENDNWNVDNTNQWTFIDSISGNNGVTVGGLENMVEVDAPN